MAKKSKKTIAKEWERALEGFSVAMLKLDQLVRACETHDPTSIEQTAITARRFLDESGYKTQV